MSKKFEWSTEQEKAIKAKGHNTLVSAGAGSGKTAVLTERIYHLLSEDRDLSISKFLVLTFTDAAAKEMKARTRKKLLDDNSFSAMAAEIENSHIETFDAFSLFLAKKYANILGVSSNLKIIDKNLLDIKLSKICDDIIEKHINDNDELFIEFYTKYSRVKDDSLIKNFILSLNKKADYEIDKQGYLDSFVDTYFNLDKVNGLIDNEFKNMKQIITKCIEDARKLQFDEDRENVVHFLDTFAKIFDYDEFYKTISGVKFPDKIGKCTEDTDLRNKIKANFVSVQEGNYGTRNEIITSFFDTKKYVEKVIELVNEINKEYDGYRFKNNVFNFMDVQKLALKALSYPDVLKEVKDSFEYIMVDEYQDTSDIQEEVLNLLSKDNIYMVGDIKQSIYRFRQANPDIFIKKYNTYGENKIDLNTSYRSRKEVVNLVNELFTVLMNKDNNPINYVDGHIFGYGFNEYDGYIDPKEDYNLKIYNYTYEKSNECTEKEANIICNDIINKINNGYLVFDKELKENKFRKCTFKDFAVICDRLTSSESYRRVFLSRGIPLNVMADEKVKESDVSLAITSLLKVYYYTSINNLDCNEYKHAYVSLARSFLIGESDENIYTIVKNNLYKNHGIDDRISSALETVRHSSLYEIICYLYKEFDVYTKVMRLGMFANNMHKSQVFLNIFKEMDELGLDMKDAIEYFDDVNKLELDIPYSGNDAVENSVKLLTIHKSKGLEYPFLYIAGTNKQFNEQDAKSSFAISKKFGPILPIVGVSENNNFFSHILKDDYIKEDIEEKLRLLYVGITRARERLIILRGSKEKENDPTELMKCDSISKILGFSGICNKYYAEYPNDDTVTLNNIDVEKHEKNFEIKEVSFDYKIYENKKASKNVDEEVDSSLLDFGNLIHSLLETVDLKTKDTSFIKDVKIRKYIENVINSPLFSNIGEAKVCHEYKFYDTNTGVNGVIDCMAVYDDHIDIIDYKLKNISDEHYDLQLNAYRDYINTLTKLPIKCYLISAITGEIRNVGEN